MKFFSQLQNLSLPVDIKSLLDNGNVTTLFRNLAKNTMKIIALNLKGFYKDYGASLFHALICIIKLQKELRKFSIFNGYHARFHGIISALKYQKKIS
ncbi:hypothetical protein F8M41_005246 [Gigaspora margarita]|uniref:Uncharacterized protein n=1 Tax=Gigaspora margarita TaxID=4874 RepID=A0A8H4A609_GIGMA|nr:hypothetical protein F8M41_005246 [Gigaspora margarita]